MTDTPQPNRRNRLIVPIVVTMVAAIVALLVGVGPMLGHNSKESAPGAIASASASDTTQAASQQDAQITALAALARRTPGDPVALGKEDAPVVIIEYSEFQCPFCGKFARDTEPALIEQYVEDGTLRIEWRDFPYLGPESTTAAQGGRAAAAQNSFWAFHDEMYADQLPPNSGNIDEDYLAGIAGKLGLDVEQFRTDMSSRATEQAIAEDFSEGQAIGVTGTPAFVINGVPVIGAQPTEVFEKTIEQAAAEAG